MNPKECPYRFYHHRISAHGVKYVDVECTLEHYKWCTDDVDFIYCPLNKVDDSIIKLFDSYCGCGYKDIPEYKDSEYLYKGIPMTIIWRNHKPFKYVHRI